MPVQGWIVPRPQPPPAPKTGPLTRGRAAASSKGETGHGSISPGAGQAGDAEPRLAPIRDDEPRRGVARGLLVEALVGGSPFLLGKIFDVTISTFRCLHIFLGNDFSYVCSHLLG